MSSVGKKKTDHLPPRLQHRLQIMSNTVSEQSASRMIHKVENKHQLVGTTKTDRLLEKYTTIDRSSSQTSLRYLKNPRSTLLKNVHDFSHQQCSRVSYRVQGST